MYNIQQSREQGSNKDVLQVYVIYPKHDWHPLIKIKYLLHALNNENNDTDDNFQSFQQDIIMQKIILHKMSTAHIRIASQMSSKHNFEWCAQCYRECPGFLALAHSQGINWIGAIRAPGLAHRLPVIIRLS